MVAGPAVAAWGPDEISGPSAGGPAVPAGVHVAGPAVANGECVAGPAFGSAGVGDYGEMNTSSVQSLPFHPTRVSVRVPLTGYPLK